MTTQYLDNPDDRAYLERERPWDLVDTSLTGEALDGSIMRAVDAYQMDSGLPDDADAEIEAEIRARLGLG